MSLGRESVAVVGAGVSGLTAAYLLQRRYDVSLFESEPRLGGHANTHDVLTPDGDLLAIDSGFIVCNESTYPNLMRLLTEIGVPTVPAPMGMSIHCEGCGLVYAGGNGVAGLLADPRSTLRPRFAKMLAEVVRFQRDARRFLEAGGKEQTLGEFLSEGQYSAYFRSHYILPVVSAVWSTGPLTARNYPARYLFRFLEHHGMLSVRSSVRWRTVPGGSRRYVERAVKDLTAVHTSSAVRAIIRNSEGVEVRDATDYSHHFDRVVVATHADTALSLLVDPTDLERSVLGAFTYSTNEAVLHSDPRLLPIQPAAQSSWNYLLPSCGAENQDVIVSYYMNRLQSLPGDTRYVVSLNAGRRVSPADVVERVVYQHPVYSARAVAAQAVLPDLNRSRTVYAGAYHGWGFHEDGCRAGAEAAAFFGVPW